MPWESIDVVGAPRVVAVSVLDVPPAVDPAVASPVVRLPVVELGSGGPSVFTLDPHAASESASRATTAARLLRSAR